MSTQTYNVTSASLVTNTTVNPVTTVLQIVFQEQPTTVNGTSVSSPYSGRMNITSPSSAQITKYTATGATITLASDT